MTEKKYLLVQVGDGPPEIVADTKFNRAVYGGIVAKAANKFQRSFIVFDGTLPQCLEELLDYPRSKNQG